MKSALKFVLLVTAVVCAACGGQANPEVTPEITRPAPEVTPETTAEATAEVMSLEWQTFVQSPPTAPGWVFQHPAGWEIIEVNNVNVFLYSAPGIGERLFTDGLQPGQLVFQFSLNPAAEGGQTAQDHLTRLTSAIRTATYGDPEPVSIAGLDGVQQRVFIESPALTALAITRELLPGRFIDIIAYSRADEVDANRPTIDTVIESVRYSLATE